MEHNEKGKTKIGQRFKEKCKQREKEARDKGEKEKVYRTNRGTKRKGNEENGYKVMIKQRGEKGT